jgi:multicomponent Na+:H+ antiporter subunit D
MINYEPVLIVITPVIAAAIISFLLPFLKTEKLQTIPKYIALTALALPFFYLIYIYPQISTGILEYRMGGWRAPYAINLVIDSFSYMFLLTASLITLVAFVFSIRDENKAKGKFSFFFLLMVAGMYGVFLSGDLFNVYVFFELCVITSYILVTLGDKKNSLKAAFTYLILGSAASLFLLIGIGLLYLNTGALNIFHLSTLVPQLDSALQLVIFTFLFGAVAVKAAIPPFHTWLVDAHSTAPSAVSAVLSAITVKIGLYIFLRVFSMGFTIKGITDIVIILGLIAVLGGVLFALIEYDIKRMLAFSTISHIGLIIVGIGTLSGIGVAGGLYHIINHAIFKGLLFLCAGAIIYRTGTKDIRKHGLGKTMPITLITYLIAAFAISGVTPFNGSVSKSMIESSLGNHHFAWFLIMFASIGTVTIFSKILYYSFLKSSKENKERQEHQEVPFSMQLSMIILAFFCVILGVFPHLWLNTIILPSTSSLIVGYSNIQINFYEPFSLVKEWVIIGLGIILLKVVLTRAEYINKFRKAIKELNINIKVVFIMFSLTLILFMLKIIN